MASDDEDENFLVAALSKVRAVHIDSSLKELVSIYIIYLRNSFQLSNCF